MQSLLTIVIDYNMRMLPIILESSDEKSAEIFIETFLKDHRVEPFNCFIYEPENKEFSIKQIRAIINETTFHSTEPRLFILKKFDTASIEAQNAFLKTLEEHQQNLYFILIVERATQLLPTIRSRSRIEKLEKAKNASLSPVLTTLLNSLREGDSSSLFRITNQIGKLDAISFFDALIAHYRIRLNTDKYAPKILKEIVKQRNYLQHNHIDPQTTIDAVLITIYKTHNPSQP